jgi:hypothetical protein
MLSVLVLKKMRKKHLAADRFDSIPLQGVFILRRGCAHDGVWKLALYASSSSPIKAKVVRVPRIAGQVDGPQDPKRLAWHEKMTSKRQRAAAQIAHFGVAACRGVKSKAPQVKSPQRHASQGY